MSSLKDNNASLTDLIRSQTRAYEPTTAMSRPSNQHMSKLGSHALVSSNYQFIHTDIQTVILDVVFEHDELITSSFLKSVEYCVNSKIHCKIKLSAIECSMFLQ